jgi:hypothetical protein
MKATLFSIILFISINLSAQKGKIFPSMECETVKNETYNIPQDTKGKFTIMGLSWSKKSEHDWETWLQPIYDRFISSNNFMQTNYDINVYFVVMFTGVNQAAYKNVMEKTQKQLGDDAASYLLFYKGKLKEYKKELKLGSKEIPHFYVLDENGKVIYIAKGKCTDVKLGEIDALLPNE